MDLLGTFAFAVFGANIAMRKKLDLFGIITCCFLTAFGGGTIRSLLLAEVPFYFFDNIYIYTLILGMIFGILTYRYFKKIKRVMLLVDAVGLSTFALIGAAAASSAGLGMFGIIFMATINAVGGGILRDAVIGELPSVFHEGLYATPAALLGVLFGMFWWMQDSSLFIALILALSFFIRLSSIYWDATLWNPSASKLVAPESPEQ